MTVDSEFGTGASDPSGIQPEAAPRRELGATTLDALRAVVEQDVQKPPIEINVPSRPGMSVRYSTDLEEPLFRLWQRQTKDRTSPSGYDDLQLSQVCLVNQAIALVVGDDEVLEEGGRTATFQSPEVIALFRDSADKAGRPPVKDAATALRECYANDGHLLAVAQEVIRECGYGEEVIANAPNPTRTRSRR